MYWCARMRYALPRGATFRTSGHSILLSKNFQPLMSGQSASVVGFQIGCSGHAWFFQYPCVSVQPGFAGFGGHAPVWITIVADDVRVSGFDPGAFGPPSTSVARFV